LKSNDLVLNTLENGNRKVHTASDWCSPRM
jgi:hypothetical protein